MLGALLLLCCHRNFVFWVTDGAGCACFVNLSSCLWRFVALFSCEHVLFEGCLGARRAPWVSRMAPGRLQRGCLEGAKCCFFLFFNEVFTFSMHLAFWLIRLALGGAHVASEMADVDFPLVFYGVFCLATRAAFGWRQI